MCPSIKSWREPNVLDKPGAQYTCFNRRVSFSDILTMSTALLLKGKSTSQHDNDRKLSFNKGKRSHYCPIFYGHYIFLPKDCGKFPKGKRKEIEILLKLALGKGVAVEYLGNILGYYMLKQILNYLSCSNYISYLKESKTIHTASKLLGNCW